MSDRDDPMAEAGDGDALGLWRWGIRRYGAIVVLCALAFAAVAVALEARRSQVYEASALVVAKTAQDLRPEILPRFGEDIFSSGVVARAVAADPRIGGDPATIVPRRVAVETEQDSISFTVVGRDTEPQRAALLANVAANAYRDELNRVSPNGAKFDVQAAAQVPTEPAGGGQPLWLAQTLGAVGGLVLGLGLVATIVVLRRPVVTRTALSRATDAPVLGTVTLPRVRRGELPAPRGVPGLTPVLRLLLDGPVSTVAVASPPGADVTRARTSALLAVAMSRVRRVRFEGAEQLRRTVRAAMSTTAAAATATAAVTVAGPGRPESAPGRAPARATDRATERATERPTERGTVTVIDGVDVTERLEVSEDDSTRVVLVVPEGTPTKQLRLVADDFLPGEIFGCVLVRRGTGRAKEVLGPAPAEEATPSGPPRVQEVGSAVGAAAQGRASG